jgi:hypothetical protein
MLGSIWMKAFPFSIRIPAVVTASSLIKGTESTIGVPRGVIRLTVVRICQSNPRDKIRSIWRKGGSVIAVLAGCLDSFSSCLINFMLAFALPSLSTPCTTHPWLCMVTRYGFKGNRI